MRSRFATIWHDRCIWVLYCNLVINNSHQLSKSGSSKVCFNINRTVDFIIGILISSEDDSILGYRCEVGRTTPVGFHKDNKIFDLDGYPNKQARWLGDRARPFGMSAKNSILPLLQQGQIVMSVPVSWSIISSRDAASFSGGSDTPIKFLMVFKYSLR